MHIFVWYVTFALDILVEENIYVVFNFLFQQYDVFVFDICGNFANVLKGNQKY